MHRTSLESTHLLYIPREAARAAAEELLKEVVEVEVLRVDVLRVAVRHVRGAQLQVHKHKQRKLEDTCLVNQLE